MSFRHQIKHTYLAISVWERQQQQPQKDIKLMIAFFHEAHED
jgi:hypothetical protein